MAELFKQLWECDDCYEQYEYADAARGCCMSKANPVYCCEVCDRDHDSTERAKACCAKYTFKDESEALVEIQGPTVKESLIVEKTPEIAVEPIIEEQVIPLAPPQTDCPRCGIAQTLGTVISCSCMRRISG